MCYPYRQDVWVRVPGSGVGDSREEAEGGDGWAHPRDEERGTGYRLGKGLAFGSSQTFAEGKELPLLSYTHAAREDDIVFCGVCGASLWLSTKPEFAERNGDIVSINVSMVAQPVPLYPSTKRRDSLIKISRFVCSRVSISKKFRGEKDEARAFLRIMFHNSNHREEEIKFRSYDMVRDLAQPLTIGT